MTRLFALLCLCLIGAHASRAQQKTDIPELSRPRLVVGLMIDQMRWDYLTRYADHYGDGGFRRLMREGWNCNRTRINYIPAVTAVGHTSVWTGSVPAIHGITGNDFPMDGKFIYCTYDEDTRGVGTRSPQDRAGRQSPHNLLVTTLGDELRLATNLQSRVIGVALKDRAAILPAGHSANAAYWFDEASGNFVTSSYYMEELPQWIKDFNGQKLPAKYMKQLDGETGQKGEGYLWPLIDPQEAYTQSTAPGQAWEDSVPHTVRYSPMGNTLTFDMARAIIEGERLGTASDRRDNAPDMLCISLSSPDMISHLVSPNSIWMEDVYVRIDRDLEAFLNYLDEKVGKGEYVFFLSADHAGMHNPAFMQERRLPGDTWKSMLMEQEISQYLGTETHIMNMQAYVPHELRGKALEWLRRRPEIAYAFCPDSIPDYVPEPIRTCVVNGYNPQRSGAIQLIYQSGVQEDTAPPDEVQRTGHIRKGMTHAVWGPDDTHIPLIFFGRGVSHRWDNQPRHITDIAATLSALLNIQEPSGCVGEPITLHD